MKSKKESLLALLALVICLAFLLPTVGCGEKSGENGPTEKEETGEEEKKLPEETPAESPEGKNLYDPSAVTKNAWIRFGTVSEDASFDLTDYIPVTAGKELHTVVSGKWLSSYTVFAFFDAGKTFLSEISAKNTRSSRFPDGHYDYAVTVPEGASFARVNLMSGNRMTAVVALGEVTLTSYYEMIGLPAPVYDTESPLYGKKVLFCGDSITYAKAHESGDECGWASRVGKSCGMFWENVGVSGTAICECGRGTIVTQLANAEEDLDYIILSGGPNDAIGNAPIGTVSPEGTTAFDLSTYCGALENLFAVAKKKAPNAKLGFIYPYQQPQGQYSVRQHDMSDFVAATKAVCEKWGVPLLDFYDNAEVNAILQGDTAKYMDDGTHVKSAGYEVLTPYVKAFMESL